MSDQVSQAGPEGCGVSAKCRGHLDLSAWWPEDFGVMVCAAWAPAAKSSWWVRAPHGVKTPNTEEGRARRVSERCWRQPGAPLTWAASIHPATPQPSEPFTWFSSADTQGHLLWSPPCSPTPQFSLQEVKRDPRASSFLKHQMERFPMGLTARFSVNQGKFVFRQKTNPREGRRVKRFLVWSPWCLGSDPGSRSLPRT